MRAGRLERAAELLARHEDAASVALKGRIAARTAQRQAALDRLAELDAAKSTRAPEDVIADLRQIADDTQDPVVREQAEIALSAAHDWAADERARVPRPARGQRPERDATADAGEAPIRGAEGVALPSDPIAAAAVREFEVAVREKRWRDALTLASEWAEAPGAEPAVREAFAAWRVATLADAVAESDDLVVRAWRLEQAGDRQAAVALLAEVRDRFPVDDAAISVGRVLAELRGEGAGLDQRDDAVADAGPSLDQRPARADVTSPAAPPERPAPETGGREVARATPPSGRTEDRASARRPEGAPAQGASPTPEELERIREAELAERAARRAAFADAGQRLATATAAEGRDAAYAELLAAARNSHAAREVLAEALGARFDRALALVDRAGSLRKLERVAEHRRQLDAARSAALALIFDEVRYFYPYRPPDVTPEKAATYDEVQREVDRLVEAVTVVWEAAPTARIPEPLETALPELGWLWARRAHAPERLVWPAELPDWLLGLPRGVDEVTTATFAWSLDEARTLARDRAVVARNEQVWGAFDAARDTGPMVPDKVEREQVRITNAYRALMGRSALAWHPSLHSAARGHSDYMNTTGQFGHDEVHPGTRTPFDRMRAVGYVRGISENCHMGSGDAQGAHRGWMRSSGHHRNLLMAGHKEMASAMAGGYWTQNFGLDTGFEAHLDLSGWRD